MKSLIETLRWTVLTALLLGGMAAAQADEDDLPLIVPGQPPINGIVLSPVLNQQQRADYRAAIEANRTKVQSLQQQILTERKLLVEVQLAPQYDEAAFRKHADGVLRAQTEIEVLNAQAFAKVRPSLTPEQLERLKTSPPRTRPHGGSEARPGAFPMGAPPIPPHRPETNGPAGMVPPPQAH